MGELPKFFERYGGVEYDEPTRPLGELAPHSYVIATAPRTGSTLLADALRASGGLGVALEYLELQVLGRHLMRRWGVPTDDVGMYIAMLHSRRTSERGWFGCKVHWHQLEAFVAVLTGRGGPVDPAQGVATIELLFPNTTWIRLRRTDRAAQAVSWFRARESGRTVNLASEGIDHGRRPPATPGELAEMVRHADEMTAMDARWDAAFGGRDDVIDVTYEELDGDLRATVARVRTAMGVGPGIEPEVTIAKQRDGWSEATRVAVQERLDARR